MKRIAISCIVTIVILAALAVLSGKVEVGNLHYRVF
jgi:hypothetical protein